MSITKATLKTEQELYSLLKEITDAQTYAITEAWVGAWDGAVAELQAVTTELAAATRTGRVTNTMINRSARAQLAMTQMESAIEYAVQRTGAIITADVRRVIEESGAAEYAMIESQLPNTGTRAAARARMQRVDSAQIGEMVLRSSQQITSLMLPMSERAYSIVKAELLKGMVVGDNPITAARAMVRRVRDKYDLAMSRALTIARTEMLDANRMAALAADKASSSVLTGWLWMAHLDPATCRGCVGMHGTVHPVDEPGPLDHQNGRCARIPKTKTWQELGIKGIDEPDLLQDADQWFAGLSAGEQRRMLGKQGYIAWQEGRYPRGSWAVQQTNTGWRNSQVPSAPPRAGQPKIRARRVGS